MNAPAQRMSAEQLLSMDLSGECQHIVSKIRELLRDKLHRRGLVIGLSGGIDSTVSAALCVKAIGANRVFGIMMPERDSSSDSERLGRLVAEHLGIDAVTENITPILDGAGCYRRRDEAIRLVYPSYGPEHKCKLVLADQSSAGYAVSSAVIQDPDGTEHRVRLTAEAYLQIVAATNFKQRTRKMLEYYHADRLRYAVVGTPNRLEYDQGFFVKNGDGAADVKPIAHLYKSQVYALADYLGVPQEIRERPSTTDTFPLEQSQEEFFFSVPLKTMDLCLYGLNNRVPPEQIGAITGLQAEQIQRLYESIEHRRKMAEYLKSEPLLVTPLD